MSEFAKTTMNRVRRLPARARYDRDAVYAIVDEALVCHVGFVQDGQPIVLPINHARWGDTLYLHGAPASRLLKHIAAGHPVSVSVALVDGLVLARSAYHHGVNYRSAVLFGHGRAVESDEEKMRALELITEQAVRGRWAEVRRPSQAELDATAIVAIEIESASAKARSGPPGDDAEDYALPVWAGVLPLEIRALEPVDDPTLSPKVPVPGYVAEYRRG